MLQALLDSMISQIEKATVPNQANDAIIRAEYIKGLKSFESIAVVYQHHEFDVNDNDCMIKLSIQQKAHYETQQKATIKYSGRTTEFKGDFLITPEQLERLESIVVKHLMTA
jgi:hypothetical protein